MVEIPSDIPKIPPRKPRSRISTGRDLLSGVDQRSVTARRHRDIVYAITSDQGGDASLSETRRQLVRRLAGAAVLAECLETRIANGQEISVAEYATLSSTILRIASRLGIDRRARTIAPTLNDYLSEIDPEVQAAE